MEWPRVTIMSLKRSVRHGFVTDGPNPNSYTMSDQPDNPATEAEPQATSDKQARVKAAKANLKQAKEAVKAAKKVASQAKKEVKALKKSLPKKKGKGTKKGTKKAK